MTVRLDERPLRPPVSSPRRRSRVQAVARWSAQHRWRAIAGWLVFVSVTVFLGGVVGTRQLTAADSAVGRSAPAERALAHADFGDAPTENLLIWQRSGPLDPAAAAAAAARLRTRVSSLPGVGEVSAPVTSRAGSTVLVTVSLGTSRDTSEQQAKLVQPLLAATAEVQRAYPQLRIGQTGAASIDAGLSKAYEGDFRHAELLSVPLTLLILVVSFGALVAAGVPVLLALSSVAAALGLSALASHLMPTSQSLSSVVLLVGMAVGVDYSLFYVRREREERAAGHSALAAIERAALTSGRAVVVSGLTVMVAMAGMFLAGNALFSSFAIGTILVVAVAVLGSVTVLPATLATLGGRVDRPRIPVLWRLQRTGAPPRLWPRLLRPVLDRPLVALLVAGAALLALASPVLGMRTALPGDGDLPRSIPVVQVYDRLVLAFPSQGPEHSVVLWSRGTRPLDRTAVGPAVDSLAEAAGRSGLMVAPKVPVPVSYSSDGRVARVQLALGYPSDDPRAARSLTLLRDRLMPPTVGALPGVSSEVTGDVAGSEDFNAVMRVRLPLVIGFVLVLTFAVLLLAFRSLAVSLTAIALNLLSVGAAYGLLVLVFQHRWAEGLLGFHSNGAIVAWLPLFLFVILFGLSMDYHVFVVSRVREAARRGAPIREAVATGVASSAGVVTSAALVMVAVFGIFATLTPLDLKQMGVGLAVAILLDATVVRAVLLPAAMTLLGERNWWLPGWLHRLPDLDVAAADV